MVGFLLWLLLLVFCWPIALLALVLYPIVWLLLLPLRLIGITVGQLAQSLSSLLSLAMSVALYGMIIGAPKTADAVE